jgi:hypothetical protein
VSKNALHSLQEDTNTGVVFVIQTYSMPYSREQKHVLQLRKSEILLFKVSMTNMSHIYFRDITFLFFKIESSNFQHLIDEGFIKAHKISAHSDNLYFSEPMLPIEFKFS